MNNQNLIPGQHKLTDEERARGRAKAKETLRRRSTLKQLFKAVSKMDAPNDIRAVMAEMGIPENEHTILAGIAVTTGRLAAMGDKDARRDFIKMIGADPDDIRKDKELELREKEIERKNPEPDEQISIFEMMVRERHERAHKETD